MTRPIYLLERGNDEGDTLTVYSQDSKLFLSVSGEDYPLTKLEEIQKLQDTLEALLMSMRPK
jgi:hypothetical protein